MTNITRTANGEVVESGGGLTRVSFGAPSPDQQSPLQAQHEPSRVSTGPLRFDGAQVVSAGVARYRVGEDAPTGIMSTARRDSNGLSVELQPGNPASRTLVETAARMGLVRPTDSGAYVDVERQQAPAQGDPTEAPEETKEPAEERPFAFFTETEEADLNGVLEPLEQSSFERARAAAIATVVTGEDDFEGIGKRLAEANGLSPEQGTEYVATVFGYYSDAVSRDLMAQGICSSSGEVAEFYDSIRRNPKLAQAMQQVALSGSTQTFRELAVSWMVKRNSSL